MMNRMLNRIRPICFAAALSILALHADAANLPRENRVPGGIAYVPIPVAGAGAIRHRWRCSTSIAWR